MLSTNITPIYSQFKHRPIGQVKGDTFEKTIKGSKHILRKPYAIAFDLSTLTDAQKAGAVKVQVTDTETGTLYCAPLSDIFEIGIKINRGYGDQIAFLIKDFSKPNTSQLKLF